MGIRRLQRRPAILSSVQCPIHQRTGRPMWPQAWSPIPARRSPRKRRSRPSQRAHPKQSFRANGSPTRQPPSAWSFSGGRSGLEGAERLGALLPLLPDIFYLCGVWTIADGGGERLVGTLVTCRHHCSRAKRSPRGSGREFAGYLPGRSGALLIRTPWSGPRTFGLGC